MRQSTDRRAARPVRPAAAAVSKMMSRAWSLPPQRTFVAVERNVRHRFGRGYRLRLQVADGAHPRFAGNPGNGQVDGPAKDFMVTRYSIRPPSALIISQAKGKEAARA